MIISRKNREEITLKFIDTSSKFGHRRFQTPKEKSSFNGMSISIVHLVIGESVMNVFILLTGQAEERF